MEVGNGTNNEYEAQKEPAVSISRGFPKGNECIKYFTYKVNGHSGKASA
jgi:hypothetical protein